MARGKDAHCWVSKVNKTTGQASRCRAPYLEVIPIRGNDRVGLERQRKGKYGTEKIFLCCCEVSNAQP